MENKKRKANTWKTKNEMRKHGKQKKKSESMEDKKKRQKKMENKNGKKRTGNKKGKRMENKKGQKKEKEDKQRKKKFNVSQWYSRLGLYGTGLTCSWYSPGLVGVRREHADLWEIDQEPLHLQTFAGSSTNALRGFASSHTCQKGLFSIVIFVHSWSRRMQCRTPTHWGVITVQTATLKMSWPFSCILNTPRCSASWSTHLWK